MGEVGYARIKIEKFSTKMFSIFYLKCIFGPLNDLK
jgi:hypothetical protein